MDEQKPAEQQMGNAPFYVQIRAEGHMINAYMAPRPGVQTDHPEPLLIGSIMQAACDATGGADDPMFREFVTLMATGMAAVCKACFGVEAQGFTVQPGGSVAQEAAEEMGKPVGNA